MKFISNNIDCDNIAGNSIFDETEESHNLDFSSSNSTIDSLSSQEHEKQLIKQNLESEEEKYHRLNRLLSSLKAELQEKLEIIEKMKEKRKNIRNANSQMAETLNLVHKLSINNVIDIVEICDKAIEKCDEVSSVNPNPANVQQPLKNPIFIPSVIQEENENELEITDHDIEY